MEIVISVFAVIVAAGCFFALMASHWKGALKARLAKAKVAPQEQDH